MDHHWLRAPKIFILTPLLLLLILVIACGSSATATPSSTNTPAPTNTPSTSGTPVPTSDVQTTPTPGNGDIAGPEYAPAFEEYWNPPTDYYGEPVYGGTLRINFEDPLEHGNSWGAYTAATTRLRNATMNKLVDIDPYDSSKVIPDLARGWTNHPDTLGLTLYFHDNITWHNGAPFTCEDARFSLETMVTGEGLTVSEMGGKLGFLDMENSKCLDDLTLELRFKNATTTALLAFYDRAANIFNKAWFEEKGELGLTTDISVGTGPFIWAANQRVGVDEQRFEKNPNYFKSGLPYVDDLVIFGIVDESRQQSSMLAHQTDYHWVRNFGQYDAYVQHDQILTAIRPTTGHHSIWLNARNAPFDNVEVRKALFMTMDREVAINVLLDGHGSLGFQMPPGTQWDLDEALGCALPAWCPPADGDMDRQRAEARAILEAEGFDFDKSYVMTVESDNQVQQRATFIQEQLRLIGVKVEFDLVETVAWRKQAAEGTWGDILPRNDTMPANDPAIGMNFYFRCNSAANHWTPGLPCDEEAESLLDQVAATLDPAERKSLSDELQLHTMELYWRFPLYWEQEAAAFWPEVRGYYHQPAPNNSQLKWEHMWIDPAHRNDSGASGQITGVPGGL